MNKNSWLVVVILATVLISVSIYKQFNPTENGTFRIQRSGFKEVKKNDTPDSDSTLCDITNKFSTENGNGNHTKGKTDTEKLQKAEANKEGSGSNTSEVPRDPNYNENSYKPIVTADRTRLKNHQVIKDAKQSEIDELLNFARDKVGNNYKYGGNNVNVPYNPNTPNDSSIDGVDCSGFVYQCYKHIGVNLPFRQSSAYAKLGKEVPISQMKAGDIIMFTGSLNPETGIVHTALVVGSNKVIQASGDVKVAGKIKESNIVKIKGIWALEGNRQAVKKVVRIMEVS